MKLNSMVTLLLFYVNLLTCSTFTMVFMVRVVTVRRYKRYDKSPPHGNEGLMNY